MSEAGGQFQGAFTLSAVNCHITFLLAYRHSRGKPLPHDHLDHAARAALPLLLATTATTAWADPSSDAEAFIERIRALDECRAAAQCRHRL